MRRRATIFCRIRAVAGGGMDGRVVASRSRALPVVFYLSEERDVARLRSLDPDRDLDAFRPGEFSRGSRRPTFACAPRGIGCSPTAPERALIVFHAAQARPGTRRARRRADTRGRCDWRSPGVLHRRHPRRQARRSWPISKFLPIRPFRRRPNPHLDPLLAAALAAARRLARHHARPRRLHGTDRDLHPDFRGEAWRSAVAAVGLELVVREVRFHRGGDLGRIDWEDYRTLDAVIAVRPRPTGTCATPNRPAS